MIAVEIIDAAGLHAIAHCSAASQSSTHQTTRNTTRIGCLQAGINCSLVRHFQASQLYRKACTNLVTANSENTERLVT